MLTEPLPLRSLSVDNKNTKQRIVCEQVPPCRAFTLRNLALHNLLVSGLREQQIWAVSLRGWKGGRSASLLPYIQPDVLSSDHSLIVRSLNTWIQQNSLLVMLMLNAQRQNKRRTPNRAIRGEYEYISLKSVCPHPWLTGTFPTRAQAPVHHLIQRSSNVFTKILLYICALPNAVNWLLFTHAILEYSWK